MTLETLITHCKSIALAHDQVNYVHIGHEWDISAQEENYMAVWFETPVSISYIRSETKRFTFAINVLQLNDDYDDLDAVLKNTSDAEDVGDDLIHAIIDYLKGQRVMVSYTTIGAVTLRHFTTADLVGVRYDLTFDLQSNYRCYVDNIDKVI